LVHSYDWKKHGYNSVLPYLHILFISGLLIILGVGHCKTFNDRVISDKQTEQDVEGSGYDLICSTMEELQNTSVRIASLLVDI
jgi:hypothetical protein